MAGKFQLFTFCGVQTGTKKDLLRGATIWPFDLVTIV